MCLVESDEHTSPSLGFRYQVSKGDVEKEMINKMSKIFSQKLEDKPAWEAFK